MTDGIISGLISGVVVTIFVVIVRAMWKRIITPWFEELVYKDAMLEGKWFSLYIDQNIMTRQETISLKRHGHDVSGTLICANGPDEGTSYSVQGSFRNMILPLIYETNDRSRTDRGSITLRSVRDGERMEGKAAVYDTDADAIESIQVIWFRSIKDLEDYKKTNLRPQSTRIVGTSHQEETKIVSPKLTRSKGRKERTNDITSKSHGVDVISPTMDATILDQKTDSK